MVGKGRGTLEGEELEGFRILRTNVDFLDVDNPPKIILVTSALPEEGKSTAASRAGLRVCGHRAPDAARRVRPAPAGAWPSAWGSGAEPGLSDYLAGHAAPAGDPPDGRRSIDRHIDRTARCPDQTPLVCITAGSPTPQPAELLRSQRCGDFFEQVARGLRLGRHRHEPAAVRSWTRSSCCRVPTRVVVCLRATQTTRDQARAAKGAIDHFPTRPTGVFVTGMLAHDDAYSYGYYSYVRPESH